MTVTNRRRRLSAGVEIQPDGIADVRVWAPACRSVDIVLEPAGKPPLIIPLERDADGFYTGEVQGASAGDRYRFRLDGDRRRPDPVSRWQPDGPHDASAIVDPLRFKWTDSAWTGPSREGQVLYE